MRMLIIYSPPVLVLVLYWSMSSCTGPCPPVLVHVLLHWSLSSCIHYTGALWVLKLAVLMGVKAGGTKEILVTSSSTDYIKSLLFL